MSRPQSLLAIASISTAAFSASKAAPAGSTPPWANTLPTPPRATGGMTPWAVISRTIISVVALIGWARAGFSGEAGGITARMTMPGSTVAASTVG
ncbi:hypothetical protein D3C72_1367340 [compost metagenome]